MREKRLSRFLAALLPAFLLVTVLASIPLFNRIRRQSFDLAAQTKIRHVIIVVQENRSFDNLFHGYPGTDTVDFGYAHDGTKVQLQPVPLTVGYDISNRYKDFIKSYDNGKMDGYDLRTVTLKRRDSIPLNATQYPDFAYVPANETLAYREIASQYVLADRMFQSNIDQSFAAHLYLVAGQAGSSVNVPDGLPWGCDSPNGTTVPTLTKARTTGKGVFPCFDFKTIPDELNLKKLSWRYYAPQVHSRAIWRQFLEHRKSIGRSDLPDFGENWAALDSIAHARYGPLWSTNVVSPETTFLTDVRKGTLADVTWIVPDWKNSDHSESESDTGPSWVGNIVNAVGESQFWNSSVILITWDDSGGWYDHVTPPQLDYDGLGARVPLLIVSPFARKGKVSHVQYEFGSILRFTETVFKLPTLAASDQRANNLEACFDFDQAPRRFIPIVTKYSERYFLTHPSSYVPPDYQ